MATQDFFSRHWLAGVLVLLFALNAIWMVRMCGDVTAATEGREAPDFRLPLAAGTEGRQLALSSLRGKPVLIDFWATWCEPCLDAIPSLVALDRSHRERGLVILGVATQGSTREEIRRIVGENRIRYPIVFDEDGKVRDRYAIVGLPTLVLVDRRGVIRGIDTSGPRPASTLERLVEPLL